jgi:serine phosphatase RsbU (regulator of sigma subunit)/HAMP domain-containing protein
MAFRFTISRKISLGFGVLIFLTLVAFALTLMTISTSRRNNDLVANVYTPSIDALQEMRLLVARSRNYITSWIKVEMFSNDKNRLKTLINSDYPQLEKRLDLLSENWNKSDQKLIDSIFTDCRSLWEAHRTVMTSLSEQDDYNDANVMFFIEPMVLDDDEDVQQLTHKITDRLDRLIDAQYKAASQKRKEIIDSFRLLEFVVLLLLILLPVGGIIIALFTTRSITRPIQSLKRILIQMARGVLPQETIKNRNDEIGEMSLALNSLVSSMKSTTEFAHEVGSGNFNSHYQPLSEEDTLGYALLRMRADLRENERVLEAKVIERTEEVVRQKEEIEVQNRKLEILYKHVTDSIRYAKRLQDAILPPPAVVNRLLPESFILFKPKDIVSGDFYWLNEKNGKIYVAAVDCTGHGVPGAFMSIVANNMLNQVLRLKDTLSAGQMLDQVNKLAAKTINQNVDDSAVRDGMDMTLCIIDPETGTLEIAGANNPLYLFRNGELKEYKADKVAIGYTEYGGPHNFTTTEIKLEKGDMIYLFSDGYADQFGGPKGKKFMVGQFRSFLTTIHTRSVEAQQKLLDETIEMWRGNLEQVDDVLVMGFRIQ